MKKIIPLFFLSLAILWACGDDDNEVVASNDDAEDADTGSNNIGTTPTSAFDEFNSDAVTISFSGDQITIASNGLPNHRTPYWTTESELYVDPIIADIQNMSPGTIDERSYTLTVDASPELAASSTETGLGAIGISITGAPIYNDQEGPNVALTDDVASGFDWAGAHFGPQGYHYHIEAYDVDENNGQISHDDHQLVGIMSDGFLLYGRREENGEYPTDLDESGGHVGTTQHSDEPFYHYHIINEYYLENYVVLFGVDLQGTPNTIL